ncbi:MAG: hypothetical protein AAGD96_24680 [Chloroflexota bacterium]
MNDSESRAIPIWIMVYAAVQILTSIVGIYGGYVDLAFFYSQFPNADFVDPLVKHLGAVWASKNVATVLVMIYAIVRKHPQILATAFLLKGIADTIDILYSNTAFLPESSFVVNLVTWLILGLPQFAAAYILFRRAGLKL